VTPAPCPTVATVAVPTAAAVAVLSMLKPHR